MSPCLYHWTSGGMPESPSIASGCRPASNLFSTISVCILPYSLSVWQWTNLSNCSLAIINCFHLIRVATIIVSLNHTRTMIKTEKKNTLSCLLLFKRSVDLVLLSFNLRIQFSSKLISCKYKQKYFTDNTFFWDYIVITLFPLLHILLQNLPRALWCSLPNS